MAPGAELVSFVYCDLSGIVRGRAFPSGDLELRRRIGVGWVPANQSLTPFGEIAEPNPFGSRGDLRLMPVGESPVRLDAAPGATALEFQLCEAIETDGRPWDCCPRAFLRTALDDLREQSGLQVRAAFEHEFQVLVDEPASPPFSLAALRRFDPLPVELAAALETAGAQPEGILAEYGPHQYEVPCRPALGAAAADRSVIVKEVVREMVRRRGLRCTFAPLTAPDAVGNGVHIHLSLIDEAGRPAGYDARGPAGMSTPSAQFAAGVLRHAPALIAFTAPSAISQLRLQPHRWSVGAVAVRERDREALLRVCPVVELGGGEGATQHNLEYRAADATASPYLALATIVRAGLEGIRANLALPAESSGRLPDSLEDALQALERDPVASAWLPPRLLDAYLGVKRSELASTRELEVADRCARYAEIY